MRKIGLIGLALLLTAGASLFAAGGGQQQGGARPSRLRMATGGVTGTYYPFGTAIAQVLSDAVGIPIVVEATGASRANIQFVDAGEAELALVQNDVADYAFRGVDMFDAEGSITSFSAVAALYPEVIQIIANPAAGISSIADLRGKRVSVGDAGSGVEFNSRQILEAYVISFNDIRRQNLGFGASAEALKDGRIDAFFVVAGPPTPAIIDLALTNNIIVLAMDDAAAARLKQRHPVYVTYTIPAGTYQGQNQPVQTVSVMAILIVANRVPEETVFQMTKALIERRDAIAAGHARGADISPQTAAEGIPFPFHPGAARFLRQIGSLR